MILRWPSFNRSPMLKLPFYVGIVLQKIPIWALKKTIDLEFVVLASRTTTGRCKRTRRLDSTMLGRGGNYWVEISIWSEECSRGSVVPHLYSDIVGNCQLWAERRRSGQTVKWSINIYVNLGVLAWIGYISWNNQQMTQQTATKWWGVIVGWIRRDGMARIRMTGVIPTPLSGACIY
jgi:hypothetical protein